MSEIKARYVGGSETGVFLNVELANGERRPITIPKGGELPTEIDGVPVPASYRDSLLEQKDNWTSVKRSSEPAKAEKKEA